MCHVFEEFVGHVFEVFGGALNVGQGILDFDIDLSHAFHVGGVLFFDFPYCVLESCSCCTAISTTAAISCTSRDCLLRL